MSELDDTLNYPLQYLLKQADTITQYMDVLQKGGHLTRKDKHVYKQQVKDIQLAIYILTNNKKWLLKHPADLMKKYRDAEEYCTKP
jgi:hypothetical protein